MNTYSYSAQYEGYQLNAEYEYEPADHEVNAPAVFTVVALSINDSPFDAMELVAPSVIEWLEDEIAKNHSDECWADAYDEWRDQQLMLEAA